MKDRGFIQIPLLIAIIAGILVIGGAVYFGVSQYKNSQQEKESLALEVEKLKQENESAKNTELEALKKEVDALKSKQSQVIVKEQARPTETSVDTSTLTQKDIEPFLDGVVRINCDYGWGSGLLWKLSDGYFVLTNKHVISGGETTANYQTIQSCNLLYVKGSYFVDLTDTKLFANNLDAVFVRIKTNDAWIQEDYTSLGRTPPAQTPIEQFNYSISQMRRCSKDMSIGARVTVVGFPLSTNKTFASRTLTEGVISAVDRDAIVFNGLPNADYYTSAKIDSGNSGGVAFSKDNSGVCFLGLPTWVSIGYAEAQGLVQNSNNLFK